MAEAVSDRTTVPQSIVQEVRELERLGHEYQIHASMLLRSGRPGWEAWFEAGLELKRTAERLRLAGVPAERFEGAATAAQRRPANEPRFARRETPSYPYAKRP